MDVIVRLATILSLATILACSQPPTSGGGGAPSGQSASEAAKPRRITAAVRAELPTLSKTLNTIIPGATALDRLVSAGLTAADDGGVLRPQLAEAVPSLE